MRPTARLAAASLFACLAAMLLGSPGLEVLWGMFGPLFVSVTSRAVAERTYRQNPERLTSVMVVAFGAKMVFFGAYVAFALKLLMLHPVPFMISFTAFFIALHLAEALSLRRLFTEATRAHP